MEPKGQVQPGTGRYAGQLEDLFDVIINSDYGADHSSLSMQHIRACNELGVEVTSHV